MATTNLLVWDPSYANQLTDAQYAADPTRSGGAVDPTILLSVLANKAYGQWSTYLTALFTAFANKGFTTSDSNLSTLTAQCAHFLTSADVLPPLVAVMFSATPTFNAAASDGFQMTLTGNITSSTISGVSPGQTLAFCFVQDSTGGRTVVWPTGFVGALQPDPAPNAVSFILFQADLAGVPRSIGPVVSNNSYFTGPLSATSLTLSNPGTGGQVLTNVGGFFVPRNSVANRVDTANGSYIVLPDGTTLQWGIASASAAAGDNDYTVVITFPTPFPNAVQTIQTTLGGLSSSGGKNKSVGVVSGTITLSGFHAGMAAMVYVGGSGTNFTGSETIQWFAVGY